VTKNSRGTLSSSSFPILKLLSHKARPPSPLFFFAVRDILIKCKFCCTKAVFASSANGLGMWRVWAEEKGVYRVLVGKPEGKRPLGRPRYRWVDNIRMDLQEVGCGHVDWIGLAQDRDRWRTVVSAVMNLRVPLNGGSLTSCKPVSCSRSTLHHGVSK